MSERKFKFDTLQLHAAQVPDPTTGASAVPIYQTTSFVFKNFEQAKAISSVEEFGFDYTRITNPTNEVLENRIAALEGGTGALALASGSAATAYSILNITHAGDEIVAAKTLYGGSFNLFANTLPKHGIKTTLVDPVDPENFRRAITEKTRAIFVETIGNPDINIIDFEAVARIAEANGIPLIIDNTFGTPYLFRPFDYGANISVHSATKFIGGHGTSIGGLIVDGGNFNWANGKFPDFTTPDPAYSGFVHWDKWGNYPGAGNIAYIIKVRLHYLRDFGACMSPFNAFLFLQGLETATREPVEIGSDSKSRPSDSKIERFGRAILRIEDGQALIPISAPFLEKFLYETSAFPNISDDDQVDSMSQVVANFDYAISQARRNKRNFG